MDDAVSVGRQNGADRKKGYKQMTIAFRAGTLAARFALELAALAGLSYWGFHAADEALPRVVLAMAAPVVAAVAWGLLASPRATLAVPGVPKVAVQLLVFGLAAAALAHAGQPVLGAALLAAFLVNAALLGVLVAPETP